MIIFDDVVKKFGSHTVLDGLSLEIKQGKITFIIGKSGEGKSVTIKHIMGLMKPDAGKVIVNNLCVSELDMEESRITRRKFGMLFQHAALFDSLTVFENVIFRLENMFHKQV